MIIIPAIDIINGQCVRLTQGDYTTKTVYDSSPAAVAKRFEDAGFTNLHLVDLDGAKAGKVVNVDVLTEITKTTQLKVDFGGGIKSDADIQAVFDGGAAEVTCGSIAVKDPATVKRWVDRYGGDKLILGADVKGRMIATHGWTQTSDLTIDELLEQYLDKGLIKVICTDIATDGMLSGPSLELYKQLISSYPAIRLIASGGVSSMDDIKKLQDAGLYGAIVGKAIYEKNIDINELGRYANA